MKKLTFILLLLVTAVVTQAQMADDHEGTRWQFG